MSALELALVVIDAVLVLVLVALCGSRAVFSSYAAGTAVFDARHSYMPNHGDWFPRS